MKSAEIFITFLVIAIVLGVAIFLTLHFSRLEESKSSGKNPKKLEFSRGNDFYVYNYYKVPVDVKIRCPNIYGYKEMVSKVPSGGRLGVKSDAVNKNVLDGSKIKVYTHTSVPILLGKSKLVIPKNKTIKALHVGLNSSHEDISMASEITKSSLGSALPRIRLVNLTPRDLTFRIGWQTVKIQPHSSYMYLGENYQGIHMGTVIRDMDGYLQDFVVDKPITDIHFGFISDIKTPLYTGSKLGGELDDTVEGVNYLQELHGLGGPHNGSLRDKTYIP